MTRAQWTNPLEVQLPIAPSLKIYCLYGHGKETEVGAASPQTRSVS